MALPDGKQFDRDFDVGERGLTGMYDSMLGRFKDNSNTALVSLVLAVWVFSWPEPLLKIGPILTLGFLVRCWALFWSWRAWAALAEGVWYGRRWLELERRGLLLTSKNEHVFRVIFYRHADDQMILDDKAQERRFKEEVWGSQSRKKERIRQTKHLAKVTVQFIAIPIAIFLFPLVLRFLFPGPASKVMALLGQLNFDEGVAAFRTWSADHDSFRSYGASVSDWLMHPDVRAVFTSLTLAGFLTWWWFLFQIVPAATALGWTLFDDWVHVHGYQYIPAARVLEPIIDEKTLDTVATQKVHGASEFVAPADAARSMSE